MTRRICSGCGHTLVQPTADVDGVMGTHMDQHTAMHQQRGEASWWIIDATPDPASLRHLIIGFLIGVATVAGRLRASARALSIPQGETNHPDLR
jgi:hypothetical protein